MCSQCLMTEPVCSGHSVRWLITVSLCTYSSYSVTASLCTYSSYSVGWLITVSLKCTCTCSGHSVGWLNISVLNHLSTEARKSCPDPLIPLLLPLICLQALPPAATPPGTPMFVITPITEPPPPNTAHKHSSPPSPLTTHKHSSPTHASQCSYSTLSWRRTPSYEKLQEFTLPSVQEGSVATRMSGDRQEDGYEVAPMFSVGLDRRQTQSMVTMRRRGEGEEFALSPMSLDQRRRQTLSMSGSAYSTESGDGERTIDTYI